MIYVYNILMILAIILALPFLLPYLLFVKKRRKTALYRLGLVLPEGAKHFGRLPESNSKRLWVHAMSVGEVISARPMIRQIKISAPDAFVVLTVSTLTGYQTARQVLAENADEISFYPYDFLLSVKSIVKRIRPDMFILVESDCWPNILNELKKKKIPLMLVNARLSDRSFSSYMKKKRLASLMYGPFTRICVQCDEDARRFQALGIEKNAITVTGNIKFDQNIEMVTGSDIDDMRHIIGAGDYQKIWVAGSTHNREEQIIAEALGKIKKTIANLMLVIAPRDPNRSRDVVNIFNASGFKAFSLSDIESGNGASSPDVVVIDRIGLLRRLYAVADVALVGGSLTRIKGIGGHNPLEPAAFSKPTLFGKYMTNYSDITKKFISAEGAVEVADAEDLSYTMLSFLSDPEKASAAGERAYWVFADNKGALKNTMRILNEYFGKLPQQEQIVVPLPSKIMQPSTSFQEEKTVRMAHHRR